MQNLIKPNEYPEALRNLISQTRIGIELANRWMLGWPGRVKSLIKAGEYPAAFTNQVEQDRKADIPEYNHLSSWEKREVMGMTEEPPTVA